MMLGKSDFIANPAREQVMVSRIFDAPIDLVFSMWTNPEYLAIWWGPKNNTNTACEMDARKGGAIKIAMHLEDGQRVYVEGVFNEVSAPSRLVFTTTKDKEGRDGLEVLHTVTLTGEGSRTRVVMTVAIIKTAPEFSSSCQGMEAGWNQTFDRLAAQLILQTNKISKHESS